MKIYNKYPLIFVHGMFGWGDAIGVDKVAPYWGGSTGNLREYLTKCNFECYCASVGPVGSAWDNACELYAQLMGTRVDYGEAHSKAHGHRRFGRTYKKPLCEGFGERKVHLIGHSHGGQVRIPFLINGLYTPTDGLFPDYAGGAYAISEKTKMIVSRGLCKDEKPRVFNPPELVFVDILPT